MFKAQILRGTEILSDAHKQLCGVQIAYKMKAGDKRLDKSLVELKNESWGKKGKHMRKKKSLVLMWDRYFEKKKNV